MVVLETEYSETETWGDHSSQLARAQLGHRAVNPNVEVMGGGKTGSIFSIIIITRLYYNLVFVNIHFIFVMHKRRKILPIWGYMAHIQFCKRERVFCFSDTDMGFQN